MFTLTRDKFGKQLLAVTLAMFICVFSVGCSTSWVDVALKDLPVLVQIAGNILNIIAAAQGQQVDPLVQQQMQQVAQQVQSDLTLLQTLANEYQNATTTAAKQDAMTKFDTALTTVQNHLNDLLAASHVKDAKLLATINGVVALALTTTLAIQSLLPPTTKTAHKASPPQKPPTAKQLRQRYNTVVTDNGYGQYAIQ